MTGKAQAHTINEIATLIRSQASQYYDDSGMLLDPTGDVLDNLADQVEAMAVTEPTQPVRRYWRKTLFVLVSWPLLIALAYAAVYGLFYGTFIVAAIFYRSQDIEFLLFATALAGTSFGLLLGTPFFKLSNWLDSLLYRAIVGVNRTN